MKEIFICLFILFVNNTTYSQNNMNDIGRTVTMNLMKDISPNSGNNGSFEIGSYYKSTYNNEVSFVVYSKWYAKRSSWLSDEELFEVHTSIFTDEYGNIVEIKKIYENEAVKGNWSVSEGLGSLALLVGTSAAVYSSYNSSSKNNSNSTNKYSNNYSTSSTSSYEHNIGDLGVIETPFTTSNGDGWIGGVFFRNKYVLKLYVKITGRKIENGIQFYKFYLYNGEVGYGSSWVSYNNITGKSSAEEKCKKLLDLIGTESRYFSINEFQTYGIKF